MKFAVTRQSLDRLAPLALAAMLATAGCSSYGNPASPRAQMAFGADMARLGYWREARFRFEKALEMNPSEAKLWNNLAVASESLGDFSRALSAYKKALELSPSDSKIQQNYARFAEFYANWQKGRVETAPDRKKDDRFQPPIR